MRIEESYIRKTILAEEARWVLETCQKGSWWE